MAVSHGFYLKLVDTLVLLIQLLIALRSKFKFFGSLNFFVIFFKILFPNFLKKAKLVFYLFHFFLNFKIIFHLIF